MYKVIKNGMSIGMTEMPNYIKRAENGCFVLCPEDEAQGIAVRGTPYALLGKELEGAAETVALVEVDAGAELYAAKQTAADTDAMIVEQEYRLTLLELGLDPGSEEGGN